MFWLLIQINNANEMGPFSPERSGGLPVGPLINMCYSGEYTYSEMKAKILGKGGLVSYLGTNDGKEVLDRIYNGDNYAKFIYDAMAYQIIKEIGSCAPVLRERLIT